MLTPEQSDELVELLYPAFFSSDPLQGYSASQLELMFRGRPPQELRRSLAVLDAALAERGLDFGELLPGCRHGDSELRAFAQASARQLEDLLQRL